MVGLHARNSGEHARRSGEFYGLLSFFLELSRGVCRVGLVLFLSGAFLFLLLKQMLQRLIAELGLKRLSALGREVCSIFCE